MLLTVGCVNDNGNVRANARTDTNHYRQSEPLCLNRCQRAHITEIVRERLESIAGDNQSLRKFEEKDDADDCLYDGSVCRK